MKEERFYGAQGIARNIRQRFRTSRGLRERERDYNHHINDNGVLRLSANLFFRLVTFLTQFTTFIHSFISTRTQKLLGTPRE